MGNCVFGGLGDANEEERLVRVMTSNGGIMELYTPITAGCITKEFPGHAIFPTHDLFWRPLSQHDHLLVGHSYYLLPTVVSTQEANQAHVPHAQAHQPVREGHRRSKSVPTTPVVTPYSYRMSFDYGRGMLKRSYTHHHHHQVFSGYNTANSVRCNKILEGCYWKVKLVISPHHLLEILSQEASTQELIENVRAVAKCCGGGAFSDQWSLSSSSNSRNALLLPTRMA